MKRRKRGEENERERVRNGGRGVMTGGKEYKEEERKRDRARKKGGKEERKTTWDKEDKEATKK